MPFLFKQLPASWGGRAVEATVAVWLLWLVASVSSASEEASVCNYVFHNETGDAWATNVCIPWGAANYNQATTFLKYQCATPNDNATDTVYVQFHQLANCSDDPSSRIDMKKEIGSNLTLSFDCSGVDGCYTGFVDDCSGPNAAPHLVFAPDATCVQTTADASLRFDCGSGQLLLRTFSDGHCVAEATNEAVAGDCTAVQGSHHGRGGTLQFDSCHKLGQTTAAPTTPKPTTKAPTTLKPTTRKPTTKTPTIGTSAKTTIWIPTNPYYNKSYEETIDELGSALANAPFYFICFTYFSLLSLWFV